MPKSGVHSFDGSAVVAYDFERSNASWFNMHFGIIVKAEKVDGSRLGWEAKADVICSAKPCLNAFIHGLGSYEPKTRLAKGFSLKNLSLVDDLREDSLVDVLPIHPN